METILYLGLLFAALLLGVIMAALRIIPKRRERAVNRILMICLYALLFSMGVKTGLIEDIGSKLSLIGVTAVAFAVATVVGSASIVLLAGFVVRKIRKIDYQEEKKDTQHTGTTKQTFFEHLREPLILIAIVATGALLSSTTELMNWYAEDISEWLLYLLLFLVGIQMIHGEVRLKDVIRDPVTIGLPVLTIAGTLGGALFMPLLFEISLSEALAVSSGFGWYSLSGILLSDLGDPVLGSISFLSNLFRESLAFITIPLLASFGKYRAAISVCGATSMDVTLPMVEKSCGVTYVPISLAHGILLTIAVPFLVPLLYGIDF